MSLPPFLRALACAALLLSGPAIRHEGHDDAPAAAFAARPRMAQHSDLHEVVAVREAPERLRIWLDLFEGNVPVREARLEVSLGDATAFADPQPDGTYLLASPLLARTGEPLDLVFSITEGPAGDDLLTGSLPALLPPNPHTGPFLDPWHARSSGWHISPGSPPHCRGRGLRHAAAAGRRPGWPRP